MFVRVTPRLGAVAGLALSLLLGLASPAAAQAPRLELGGRLRGGSLVGSERPEQPFGGLGVEARYRISRRLGMEVSTDLLSGEVEAGGQRDLVHFDTAMMVYFFPGGIFELYGLGGMGSMLTHWHDPELGRDYGSAAALTVQLGFGAQLLLGNLRLSADLRAVALGPIHADSPSGTNPPKTPYLRSAAEESHVLTLTEPAADDGLAATSLQFSVAYVF